MQVEIISLYSNAHCQKKYVTLFHSTIQCITSNSFYFIVLLTFDLETGSQKQVGFIV